MEHGADTYNIVIPLEHNPELVHMIVMRAGKTKRSTKGGCYKRATLTGRYVLKTERGTLGTGEALQEIALHLTGKAQGVVASLLGWKIRIIPADPLYRDGTGFEVQMVMPRLILPNVLRKRARFVETDSVVSTPSVRLREPELQAQA